MPKVSIIIPNYNSAQHIESTVKCIQAQTLQDWELILVDDCSTDNTRELCMALAEGDKRIKYICQPNNGGPSVARNTAIDIAIGSYLAFVDSDDIIEPNYLDRLVATIEKQKADVVWCDYYEEYSDHKEYRTHGLESGVILDCHEALSFFLTERTGLGCLWNKLYRRSFIEQFRIRLNEKRVHGEDWEFNLNVFRHHPVIVPIKDALYHYVRLNSNSVIASYRTIDYDTFVYSHELTRKMAEEEGIEYSIDVRNTNFIYLIISLLMILVRSNCKYKSKEFRRICQDEFFYNMIRSKHYDMSKLSLRYKIYLTLLKNNNMDIVRYLMKF